jgi:uncharacterized membrane protein
MSLSTDCIICSAVQRITRRILIHLMKYYIFQLYEDDFIKKSLISAG